MTANKYKTVYSGKVIFLNVNFNYLRHNIAVSVITSQTFESSPVFGRRSQ